VPANVLLTHIWCGQSLYNGFALARTRLEWRSSVISRRINYEIQDAAEQSHIVIPFASIERARVGLARAKSALHRIVQNIDAFTGLAKQLSLRFILT
jgi:hypothetical protein